MGVKPVSKSIAKLLMMLLIIELSLYSINVSIARKAFQERQISQFTSVIIRTKKLICATYVERVSSKV